MNSFVVTVARGFGSGGKEIASRLAQRLGVHCYENRILTLASQLSGLDENRFLDINEKLRTSGAISGLLAGLPRLRRSDPRDEAFVSDDRLFEYQKEIILHLADTESCVIVGKCADFILKDHANVVSVYIEAPRRYCYKRIMQKMGVDESTAHRSIDSTDRYRAAYYKYYTGGNYWTNPVNYDITLNSERLGIEGCVEMILHCLRVKFPGQAAFERPSIPSNPKEA